MITDFFVKVRNISDDRFAQGPVACVAAACAPTVWKSRDCNRNIRFSAASAMSLPANCLCRSYVYESNMFQAVLVPCIQSREVFGYNFLTLAGEYLGYRGTHLVVVYAQYICRSSKKYHV